MKRELMDILACPVCKGSLALSVTQEQEDEIVEGSLKCELLRRDLRHRGHHPQPPPPGA